MILGVFFGLLLVAIFYLSVTIWMGMPPRPAQTIKLIGYRDSRLWRFASYGFIRQGYLIKIFKEEIVAVGTLFIAAFTVILAFATGFLFFATQDLVRGADTNAEKQLRAYVTISGGGVQYAAIQGGNAGFYITLNLKNSGQTPAYDFITWIKADVAPTDSSPIGDVNWDYSSRSILGPATDSVVNIWVPSKDANELVQIRNHSKKIFVWGKVEYRDAFNKKWQFSYTAWNSWDELDGVKWAISPKKEGYKETELQ